MPLHPTPWNLFGAVLKRAHGTEWGGGEQAHRKHAATVQDLQAQITALTAQLSTALVAAKANKTRSVYSTTRSTNAQHQYKRSVPLAVQSLSTTRWFVPGRPPSTSAHHRQEAAGREEAVGGVHAMSGTGIAYGAMCYLLTRVVSGYAREREALEAAREAAEAELQVTQP
eukprot:1980649-Rhodomonas_salina.1